MVVRLLSVLNLFFSLSYMQQFLVPPACKNMAESLLLPLVRRVAGKAADALIKTVTRMCGLDEDRRTLERQLPSWPTARRGA
uniref:Uncharacterized protein n=1 Tax=Aegilops tauschii subsp. strangulata TaxID=200361 RepID=A0A453QCC0_AEGTS